MMRRIVPDPALPCARALLADPYGALSAIDRARGTPPAREVPGKIRRVRNVRRFIDVGELIAMWPNLFLLKRVRTVWEAWLRQRHGARL
jgi:hypothetical protein